MKFFLHKPFPVSFRLFLLASLSLAILLAAFSLAWHSQVQAQAQPIIGPPGLPDPSLSPPTDPTPPPVVSDPVISPPGGQFSAPVTVTISSSTNCAEITYTIYDHAGNVMDQGSGQTPVTFTLEDSATVVAQASCPGYTSSQEVTAQFLICYPNCFWLAVIGHQGEPIEGVFRAVQTMVTTLQPWKYFHEKTGKIFVVPFQNSEDLGCRDIEGPSGRVYPLCPNDGTVQGALQGSQWHAIIVVNSIDCNCGTVADFSSPVVAVGKQANSSLIGHELGHVTGKMVDEYFYKFNLRGGPLGPNCFATQLDCQNAIQNLSGAACSLGCRATDTWRPATQLMHNELGQPYGPLETCVMAERIMAVIGTHYRNQAGYPFGACAAPDPSPDIPPVAPRPGQFYGGHR
ncbi:MAG: chitobiase/beta-hexosaminidase C-terminal domain-containing protein [Candidatus Andersenbacteria bacterium]